MVFNNDLTGCLTLSLGGFGMIFHFLFTHLVDVNMNKAVNIKILSDERHENRPGIGLHLRIFVRFTILPDDLLLALHVKFDGV